MSGSRYCRTCLELDNAYIELSSWREVVRHIWMHICKGLTFDAQAEEIEILKQDVAAQAREIERIATALLDLDTFLYTLDMEFCHIDKMALRFAANQREKILSIWNEYPGLLKIAQGAASKRGNR